MSCGNYEQNFWSYRQIVCSPECFQELEKIRLGIADEPKVEEVIEIVSEELIEVSKESLYKSKKQNTTTQL